LFEGYRRVWYDVGHVNLEESLFVANLWLLSFTMLLLLVTAVAIMRGGRPCRSYWLAWCGLAATMLGDYFLAVRGAPLHSDGFLYGVAGFALAHLCWIAFLRQHATWNPRLAFGLAFSLGVLFAARAIPALASHRLAWALSAYALLSIFSVSIACGTHQLSRAWRYGLSMLFFSDAMIVFGRILRVPHLSKMVGVTYLASLALIAVAILRCGCAPRPSARLRQLRATPYVVFMGGTITLLLFLSAAALYPGKVRYNPCMRMLSTLGRTRLNGIDYPACHYLFTAGMALSAWAVFRFSPALACFVKGARKKAGLLWGCALTAAGLLTIAFIPENVNGFYHNVGCFAAAGGGAPALILLTVRQSRPRISATVRWSWLIWCCAQVAVLEAFLLAHRFKLLPFAPYVPTCQKLTILTFIAFLGFYAVTLHRLLRRRER
jgi:hypothetical protein